MKKMILMALALTAGALFNGASAQKKVSKKGAAAPKVTIVSSSDSLSYAAGMAVTNGLDAYLKQAWTAQAWTCFCVDSKRL